MHVYKLYLLTYYAALSRECRAVFTRRNQSRDFTEECVSVCLPLQRRSKGVRGAGRTGRRLLGAANGRKLFLKIHVKIQIVISYVFARAIKTKHYSCSAYLSSVSWAITMGLWLRPVEIQFLLVMEIRP